MPALQRRSRNLRFNLVDFRKTIRDMFFVAVAAGLTWATSDLIPYLQQHENELVRVLAVPLVAAVIAALWRFVKQEQQHDQ